MKKNRNKNQKHIDKSKRKWYYKHITKETKKHLKYSKI